MRILFLAQRVPYPPNRGDKITTWRIVERFAREHEVTVAAFSHDEGDVAAARTLSEEKGVRTIAVPIDVGKRKLASLPLLLTGKALTLGVYGSKALQRAVDAELDRNDLAYAYSSSMGAFLLGRGTPWVMHFAELDSDKWRQYADKHGFPMRVVYRREWKTLRSFERRVAGDALTNVFCTPLEQAIFDEELPGFPSLVVRNGVALDHYTPEPDAAEPGHCVFTGVMDYYPNVDGCVWFAQDILPIVRRSVPDARFTIVGSKPTPEVLALGDLDGIEVTGFVDDTRDYLRRAAVSVAPLRVARGIQNKVLEALAMGLPTVGTTSATQGVEGEPGRDFLVADEAEAFAARVVELLQDQDEARALGARGRAFVERSYDWDRCLAPLDEILQRVTGAQPTP
ncbi:MAG: TIGR03087 family PEP-CTERM/XrtA system glycosyltransferase [Planctomycetota bacterium]